MTRLIQILLWISDCLAWVLVVYGVATAVLSPVGMHVHEQMGAQSLPLVQIIATSVAYALLALSAYLVTRRKPIGVVIVCLLSIVWFAQGLYAFAISYVGVVMLLFGTPFFLMYLQFQHNHVRKSEP